MDRAGSFSKLSRKTADTRCGCCAVSAIIIGKASRRPESGIGEAPNEQRGVMIELLDRQESLTANQWKRWR
jgi:hypothetical protein